MFDSEPPEVINEIISSIGKRCAGELQYTRLSSADVNRRIDGFHAQVSAAPTFEEIKKFNDENNGINCGLYAEAACDLLRANGITADRVNLLDPTLSTGAADNHAVVYAANRLWLEPQSGRIFSGEDWETFTSHYAKLLGIDSTNLVAYSPREGNMWVGSKWSIQES